MRLRCQQRLTALELNALGMGQELPKLPEELVVVGCGHGGPPLPLGADARREFAVAHDALEVAAAREGHVKQLGVPERQRVGVSIEMHGQGRPPPCRANRHLALLAPQGEGAVDKLPSQLIGACTLLYLTETLPFRIAHPA